MDILEVSIRFELDGWTLLMTDLEVAREGANQLQGLRQSVTAKVRETRSLETLSSDPTVAGLRRLFRAAGCDPTRYRPSSEALLRRLLKGLEMPEIHPLVDLNNCLSAELLTPCCLMANATVTPPIVWRQGRPGESYMLLRGKPLDLDRKPVLADAEGPFDVPVTGSQRVKVTPETRRAQLVSYLPAGVVDPAAATDALVRLVAAAPVAEIVWTGVSAT